jgi:hypothetical protein
MNHKTMFFTWIGGLVLMAPLFTGCPSDKKSCDGCVIEGMCVAPGAQNPDDLCLVCNPEISAEGYSPRDCTDGISCNGEETCNPDTGRCEPGEVTCPDDEFCDPEIDQCVVSCPYCSIERTCYWENQRNPENPCQVCRTTVDPYAWTANDGAVCDDGVFCNGTDTCAGGTCSVHEGDPCPDDGVFCNGAESCDEATRSCVHSEDACGEGKACDEDGQQCCQAHDHLACNPDGDVAWVDSCGQYGAVVEQCGTPPVGGCLAGQCTCGAGWTGPGCEQCIVFVTASGDDENDGRSWAEAKATLQAAVTAADASACPEIWVAEGVYSAAPSADPSEAVVLTAGLRLYGGFGGSETSLSERNVAAHPTVIDGELGDAADPTDNACRAVVMGSNSRLDGFTIRNGSGVQDCTASIRGVGVFAENVNAVIAHCRISENGGGFGDAGMWVSGDSQVRINDTVFENNTAMGGGLRATGSSRVEIADCVFQFNESFLGSAITIGSSADLKGVRCVFAQNDAPSAYGTVQISDYATALLTNCTFWGNTANVGAVNNAGAHATLVNCLLTENTGSTSGAILAAGSGPTVLQNCTAAKNTGEDTGGLRALSDLVVVRNSIFWANTSNAATVSESQILYASDTLPLVRYSTVEGAFLFPGQANQNTDPLFVNDDPGVGPLDLHLGSGSPCIDAGSTALLLADEADLDGDDNITEPLPFDLDESARVAGAAVDMGAYETP